MTFWNFNTPLTLLASCVWNLCEYFGISVGKFGPTLFGLAIGRKGHKVKGDK